MKNGKVINKRALKQTYFTLSITKKNKERSPILIKAIFIEKQFGSISMITQKMSFRSFLSIVQALLATSRKVKSSNYEHHSETPFELSLWTVLESVSSLFNSWGIYSLVDFET